jgi:putative MATE family efflux protein
MLRLALPVMAEEFLNLLVGYTDWWLTGHFLPGHEYQAAMSLVAYTLWFIPSLFAAVSIGALALVSRHAGAGDMPTARRVANQAILAGAALAALATLGAALGAGQFVTLMQLRGEAARLALAYLAILIPAIPFIMVEQVAAACLRGAGDTLTGMSAKVLVNIVNVVLSTALVTGWGPFPQLGWQGIAIGSACGHGVGGMLLLALLIRGRSGLALRPALLVPDWQIIRRLLRVGLPGGCDVVFVVSCHLVYVAIINSLGPLNSAAHGLGVQIEALAYLPGSAFQAAAATLAGQCLGAGEPKRATRAVLHTLLAGASVMTAAGFVLFFGGRALAGFFTGNDQGPTAILTGDLLKVVALSMPSLAVVMVFSGALRGSGDTLWPLVFTFIGLVGVRIPGACLLAWGEITIPYLEVTFSGFDLGVFGAWYAMVADVVLRSLLLTTRFVQGGWRRIRV